MHWIQTHEFSGPEYRAVYTVLGHISDAEELSDVRTKTDDYLWLKVRTFSLRLCSRDTGVEYCIG